MSVIGSNVLAGASGQAVGAAGYEIERSLRFDSGSSSYLSRTPSSAGNRKTWTWSGWVKKTSIDNSNGRGIFAAGLTLTSDSTFFELRFGTGTYQNSIAVGGYNTNWRITDQVFRDPSAWYHIVLAVDTTQATGNDRIKLYINGAEIEDFVTSNNPSQNADLGINNTSAHFIGDGYYDHFDGYLADVHFIDGVSGLTASDFGEYDSNNVWQPKAYSGTYGTNGFHLLDFANESTVGHDSSGNNNDFTANNLTTTAPVSYSGTSSITVNNSNTNQSGSLAAVFNGTQVANSSNAYGFTTGAMDFTWSPNTAISYSSKVRVWTGFAGGSVYLNGGSAVSTANNDWTTLVSGSSGTITSIQFTVGSGGGWWAGLEVDDVVLVDGDPADFDVLFDSPTNGTQTDTGAGGEVVGNYAVMNALVKGSGTTLDNGNLDIAATGSVWNSVFGTIFVSSGKYYAEVTAIDVDSDYSTKRVGVGFARSTDNLMSTASSYLGGDALSGAYFSNGNAFTNNTNNNVNSSYQTGDVIGVALDMDAGTVTFYKNNTVQSGTFTGLSGANCIAVCVHGSGGKASINFGQRPFAYTAPSGFRAINTASLPDPTIADGSTAMDVALWDGNSGTQTISGLGFSPDLVWGKCRSNGATSHHVVDTVRGAGKSLFPNATNAEVTYTNYLTAFTSDGFTLGNGSELNFSGRTFVGWAWNAGTSTVSNTDGSITSSVRANPSAGFSIVSFTTGSGASGGDTVGHGLNAQPGMYIYKPTSTTGEWVVVHSYNYNNFGFLNDPVEFRSISSNGGGTPADPTSSVLTLYDLGVVLASKTYVCYAFAPVAGYSSFGSYVGTGTSDNSAPFIYTGFRPKWLLIKESSGADAWHLLDSARLGYNDDNAELYPNTTAAEANNSRLDFLSNGFKLRTSFASTNQSGATYIYAAFAENPLKHARAR